MTVLTERVRRTSHQLRHVARTQLAAHRPVAAPGGGFSPAGMPSSPVSDDYVAESAEPERREIARARRARQVRAPRCDFDALALLCAAGAVVVDAPKRDDELSLRVASSRADWVRDPAEREHYGADLRRLAWRSLRPRRPSVSVLLASARPDDAVHVTDQLRRQHHVDFQLVVGLHGSAWTPPDASRFHQLGREVVVERFEGTDTLGNVLSVLSSRADGELVTKWDDDDYYGPHHLEDLVSAHLYSGADLVGRGSDFVYLEASDVTVRRSGASEAYDRFLAGGTLLLSRDRLKDVGGWGSLARHVDLDLIDRVHRAGGWTYRTHPFGYVLRRRHGGMVGHTWAVEDGYFRRGAIAERPGLALDFAGVDR